MKEISSVFFVLFVFITQSQAQIKNDPSKPLLSLNTQLPREELLKLNSATYIAQFANFILTGSYSGESQLSSDLDENDLDSMLDAGLNVLVYALANGPDEYTNEEIAEIFNDLNEIKEILKTNGTTGVKFGRIRIYLTGKNLQKAVLLYLGLNKDNYATRLKLYLRDELLGGLTGACKAHTQLWFDEIVKGRLWALQMFDSMAKMPPGILDANINWVGSFKLCTEVYNGTIRPVPLQGKYCRAQIGFPIDQLAGDLPIDDKIGLTYGLCISQACDNAQVASLVSNSLKLMSVFKSAWVQNVECVEKEPVTTPSVVYITLLSILVLWIFIATVIDVTIRILDFVNDKNTFESDEVKASKQEIAGTNVVSNKRKTKREKSKLEKFVVDCSFYSNTEKFFRTDNGGKITCLNGIRLFSMLWIIWGHTYNYIIDRSKFFVVDNIRGMQELNENLEAQLIINGMFGVDSFFLMSAFLLTIGFLNKLEKSKRLTPFEWAYYYIHRYWRLAPPFLITLVIYNWIMPYVGYGPLWNQANFPSNNKDCHEYWWAYVLFINNFVPNGKGTTCMGYLWYIPNDYQFYAVSPLFLILLYKFPKAGKTLLAACLVASLSVLAFLTANVYVSRKKDIALVLIDMWEDVYIKPYCRASPWIVGIFLGYLFFKQQNKRVKLNYIWVALGWILCAVLIITAVLGGYTNHAKDARRMYTFEYALYFSLTRFTWPLAVSWIIFACHNGYGGVINSILSREAYIPLTRLSYCAYLIHPVIMVTYNYQQEALFHATNTTLIYIAIAHITVTMILAYFYTLFFELPFVALDKFVYTPPRSKSN